MQLMHPCGATSTAANTPKAVRAELQAHQASCKACKGGTVGKKGKGSKGGKKY